MAYLLFVCAFECSLSRCLWMQGWMGWGGCDVCDGVSSQSCNYCDMQLQKNGKVRKQVSQKDKKYKLGDSWQMCNGNDRFMSQIFSFIHVKTYFRGEK